MLLSELIATAQAEMAFHGDGPVMVPGPDDCGYDEMTTLRRQNVRLCPDMHEAYWGDYDNWYPHHGEDGKAPISAVVLL